MDLEVPHKIICNYYEVYQELFQHGRMYVSKSICIIIIIIAFIFGISSADRLGSHLIYPGTATDG